MNNLKIAVISLDIAWNDSEENLFAAEKALSQLDKNTDIAVLPELFTTGFIDNLAALSNSAEEFSESRTLARLKDWAKNLNFAIAGTYLVKENNKIYNRAFFVEPSGEATFYDKAHLFCQSSESTNFEEGDKTIPVVRYRGWNIALAVCYEVRFPAWLRNNDNKYDVLIIPANWPTKRGYAWQHLLIARAIENQAYIVGANRSGTDDDGGVYT